MNQDYIGYEGLEYPENGQKLFQEDFQREQYSIGLESIERERDFFSSGVVSGLEISILGTLDGVVVAGGIARDQNGRRIVISTEKSFILNYHTPQKIIVRHIWNLEEYSIDGISGIKNIRRNSGEIVLVDSSYQCTDKEIEIYDVNRTETEIQVTDKNNYARLKNPQDQLPIGTIMMYDGSNWQDNVTMKGWYACIPENLSVGCPNLVDRFLLGSQKTTIGQTGGSFEKNISQENLPAHTHTADHSHIASSNNSGTHTHTANHNHTASSGNESASHTHNVRNGSPHAVGTCGSSTSNYHNSTILSDGNNKSHSHAITVDTQNVTTSDEGSHSHEITVNNQNVTTSSIGSNVSLDVTNPYYKVLYIKRCA